MNKSSFVKFISACLAVVLLTMSALYLMTVTNSLENARRNSNSITINAEFNSQLNTLTATQTVQYRNRTGTTLDRIKFHIHANAYREGALFAPVTSAEAPRAFPNGVSFGNITIAWVSVGGARVTFAIEGEDENVLTVPIAGGLAPNASATIEMLYKIRLANIRHRLGWTDLAVNLGNFYPIPVVFKDGAWQTYPYSFNGDPFFNEVHNYNVTIRADRNLIVASSGALVSTRLDGNMRTHTFRSIAIRNFAMVLSQHFQQITRVVDKVTVNYFFIDDYNPEASFQVAVDAKRTFSRLFMQFPYRQLTVVQTDFLHGGMEYGELVYVSIDVLRGCSENEPSRQFHNHVIIHEIAHQWWYGIVGNDQIRTSWIDEGLAEYSTMLFYYFNPQHNVCMNQMISSARENYSAFIALINSLGTNVDENMNKSLNDFRNSYEYIYMAYVRGLLLFVELEALIGQQKVIKSLRHLAQKRAFDIATKQCIIGAFEHITRTPMQLFFTSFLRGTVNL